MDSQLWTFPSCTNGSSKKRHDRVDNNDTEQDSKRLCTENLQRSVRPDAPFGINDSPSSWEDRSGATVPYSDSAATGPNQFDEFFDEFNVCSNTSNGAAQPFHGPPSPFWYQGEITLVDHSKADSSMAALETLHSLLPDAGSRAESPDQPLDQSTMTTGQYSDDSLPLFSSDPHTYQIQHSDYFNMDWEGPSIFDNHQISQNQDLRPGSREVLEPLLPSRNLDKDNPLFQNVVEDYTIGPGTTMVALNDQSYAKSQMSPLGSTSSSNVEAESKRPTPETPESSIVAVDKGKVERPLNLCEFRNSKNLYERCQGI